MKPPTQPLMRKPRQGTIRTLKPTEEYEDYELSESEAIALNCLEEFEESSEAGHAVQLHLAAHAALARVKASPRRAKVRARLCVAT